MNSDEFWNCISHIDIEALEQGDEQSALSPLIDHLSGLSAEKIKGFEDRLAEFLYQIDTAEHYKYAGRADGITMGDDGFLYGRCYVVAHGKAHYESVLKDPTKMPESLDQWCESLLYVASQAWEASGQKEAWNHSSPVSYETGQNKEAHE